MGGVPDCNPPRRLLLVSLSNIGDAVLTTPVLSALHARWPEALVDIVADPRSGVLFEFCPWRGRIVYKRKEQFLRGVPGVLRELRGVRYDAIVDLRTDMLPWLLRAKQRFTRRRARPYGPHAVEQHMGVIALLHGNAPLPDTVVWTGADAEAAAAARLSSLPGRRWLCLGPGARWSGKQWPEEYFRELIEDVSSEFDAVVILGAAPDRETAQRIASGSTLECHDWTGATSLLEAVAVLRKMTFFLGNDSGLGHLAAAAATPSLTLFGPGDPLRYRPWGTRAAWLKADGGDLRRLSPAGVAAALRKHLAGCGRFPESDDARL